MMIKSIGYFLPFVVLIYAPILSMENSEKCTEKPNIQVLFTSSKNNIAKKINKDLNSLSKTAEVEAGSPFGNTLFGKIRSLSAKFGFSSNLLQGRGGNLSPHQDTDITITNQPSLHAKYLLLCDEKIDSSDEELDNTLEILPTKVSYIGSYNGSGISDRQIEVIFRFDDAKTHKKLSSIHQQFIKATTPEKNSKKIVMVTPTKTKITSSFDFDLNRSKIARIKSLSTQNDVSDDDTLYISSMTFDNQELVDELKKTIKNRTHKLNCALFFNRDILNHKKIIEKILDNNNIKLYVYNPKGDIKIAGNTVIPRILHAKLFYRKTEDKVLVIGSTGNLTEQSNKERNIDFLLPPEIINEDVVSRVEDFFESLKKECVELTTKNAQQFIDSDTQKKKERSEKNKQKKIAALEESICKTKLALIK